METITYSQVEKIIKKLPIDKLPRAYKFLTELYANKEDMSSPQLDFLSLPLQKRRKMMEQQAQQMVAHYSKTTEERQDLQAGDFVEEYKTE